MLVGLWLSTGISDNVAMIPRLVVDMFLVERTGLHRCMDRGYRDECPIVGLEEVSWGHYRTYMTYSTVDLDDVSTRTTLSVEVLPDLI